MIPQAEIETLKSQVDFFYLLKSYGLEPVSKGKDHFLKCPFHEDDKPSLSVDFNKNLYHCFGCGEKGNAIQFVQKIEDVSFVEAFHKVKGFKGEQIKTNIKVLKDQVEHHHSHDVSLNKEERQTLIETAFESMVSLFNANSQGKSYLASRKILPELSPEHTLDKIGFCPVDFGRNLPKEQRDKLKEIGVLTHKGQPFFSNCVVFPLVAGGKVQSLYGRKIKGTGSHYYLPGKREGLYYHQKEGGRLILVESVIDALSLKQKGFSDVLALYGVNGFTQEHQNFIKENKYKQVYILMDSDPSGREASARLSQVFKAQGQSFKILELPEGHDPNSFLAKDSSLKWLRDKLKESLISNMTLQEEGDVLFAQGQNIKYALQGFRVDGFDKLRLTLRASLLNDSDLFHIDTLDLYNSKNRQRFAESLFAELGVKEEIVLSELKTLIRLLEEERLKRKEVEQSTQVHILTETEKNKALEALKSPDLIKNLLKDFEVSMIGEEKAKLLGYLGTISRLLEEPLGVLIVSRSGAGKTTLQDAICSFVPEEFLEKYTRLTGQSLFYQEKDGLKNKVLAIEEEEGMSEAIYAIRTLQSSQRLSLITTRSDPKTGKFKTEKYTVEGPVFILISTTNPESMDYETRNRFIILTINESEDQTQKIMEARKLAYTLEGQLEAEDKSEVLKKCANMQRLLRPIQVINNYAPFLEYPFDRLQMRREFKKYMTLINSIALLHQYQREIKTYSKKGKTFEYIEVELSDIALANELVLEFFPNAIDELAPHTRRLGEEISKLVKHKEGDALFTRRELRDFSGWSNWNVRIGLDQLEELEYIKRVSGKNGSLITYELQIDVCSDTRQNLILTDETKLAELLKG